MTTASSVTDNAPYFRDQIIAWGATHRRSFPWRETSDPYHILVAELMLRRTQARQVVATYELFLRRFPDIYALAHASKECVSATLYPLGLAWRAENFAGLAEKVVSDYQGEIPYERDRLLSLPGVGDYVASALRCFAFSEADPLIDTNTVRVAGRYFDFPVHAESRRKPSVRAEVAKLFNPAQPRDSASSILDFAALVCVARGPRCTICPVQDRCCWTNTR